MPRNIFRTHIVTIKILLNLTHNTTQHNTTHPSHSRSHSFTHLETILDLIFFFTLPPHTNIYWTRVSFFLNWLWLSENISELNRILRGPSKAGWDLGIRTTRRSSDHRYTTRLYKSETRQRKRSTRSLWKNPQIEVCLSWNTHTHIHTHTFNHSLNTPSLFVSIKYLMTWFDLIWFDLMYEKSIRHFSACCGHK
jgi:hypothetical protein